MGLLSELFQGPSRAISCDKFCSAVNALDYELDQFNRDYWQNGIKELNHHRDRISRMQTIFASMYDIIYSRKKDVNDFFETPIEKNGRLMKLDHVWMKVRTDLDQINYTFKANLFVEKQPPLDFIKGNKWDNEI